MFQKTDYAFPVYGESNISDTPPKDDVRRFCDGGAASISLLPTLVAAVALKFLRYLSALIEVDGSWTLGIGQVLSPNKVYAPQKLNKPVANTTMPTQPQGPTCPVAAKAINASPATTRKMRSIPPTFFNIIDLLRSK
jgi:hypothetical protein